jgi:hypothetical protein
MMGDIDNGEPSLVRFTADEPLEIDLLPQDEVTTAAAEVRPQRRLLFHRAVYFTATTAAPNRHRTFLIGRSAKRLSHAASACTLTATRR